MISKSLNSVHKLKKVKAILTTRKSKKIKKKGDNLDYENILHMVPTLEY